MAKLADILEKLGNAIIGAADQIREDHGGDYHDDANDGHDNFGGYEAEEREPDAAVEDANPVFENTMLQVPAGDLWRLVNRSRKMIRLAREGKIPDMDGRGPLRDAIRALKAQGLVRKPRDLRA